jgi:hypothetical protein
MIGAASLSAYLLPVQRHVQRAVRAIGAALFFLDSLRVNN